MSTDLAGPAAEQLRIYAAGYSDALEDARREILELVRALTVQFEQAEATAEKIYHDAYCGCGTKVTGDAIRAIEVQPVRPDSSEERYFRYFR